VRLVLLDFDEADQPPFNDVCPDVDRRARFSWSIRFVLPGFDWRFQFVKRNQDVIICDVLLSECQQSNRVLRWLAPWTRVLRGPVPSNHPFA
jgi:hypothetical protein